MGKSAREEAEETTDHTNTANCREEGNCLGLLIFRAADAAKGGLNADPRQPGKDLAPWALASGMSDPL